MFTLISILYFFIIILCSVVTLWAIIIFVINYKKNWAIYRSVLRTLFKNISSIVIIIFFYAFSFSLVGAGTIYFAKVESAVNTQIIDNKVHQGDFDNEGKIRENGYNSTMFSFLIEEYDIDGDYPIPSNDLLQNEEDFINQLDIFVAEEYGIDNFWESVGLNYFDSFNNFVNVVTFKTLFDGINNETIPFAPKKDADFDIVYNIYPYDVYKPFLPSKENELYYFMGFNSPGDSPFSLRYAGQEEDYVIDDFQIIDVENGWTKQEIEEELSWSNSDYGSGTRNDPYKIVVQDEYAKSNNLKPGDLIQIDNNNYEILATANFPNLMYPVYNTSNYVTNFNSQAAILMNEHVLYDVTDTVSYSVTYGYTDLYDQAADYTYYSQWENSSTPSEIYIREDALIQSLNFQINYSFVSGDIGLITGENDSSESQRTTLIYDEIASEKILLNVFSKLFLVIVIIVLILLIQRRVRNYGKQFGTLKALGLNNRESAISFIVYPMFIILVGGTLAFLLAIPIQMIFIWGLSNFYSLPIGGLIIPFALFYYLFIISIIILFAICFLISLWILRKSPIDLLQNKATNSANFLTRKTGYLIPKSASFGTSYKFKGLTRAFGKSMILFFAVFLATALTALSVSASTMINKVSNETSQIANFDYYSSIEDDNNNYEVYDTNQNSYYDKQPLYGDVQRLTVQEINAYNDQLLSEDWEIAYIDLGDSVISAFDQEIIAPDGTVNYYLPKEAVINYLIKLSLIKFHAGDQWNNALPWNADSAGHVYSAADLNQFMRIFVINGYSKYYYQNEGNIYNYDDLSDFSNIDDPQNLLDQIYDYGSNVNFKDLYYDSQQQSITSNGNSLGMDVTRLSNPDIQRKIWYPTTIFTSPEEINDVYNVDQSAIDALEEEEQLTNSGQSLDYLPIVMDSFTYNYLTNTYNIPVDPETGYWEMSFWTDDYYVEDIDVNVVYVYDSYISLGYLTTETLVESYPPIADGGFEPEYNTLTWSQNSEPKDNYTLAVNDSIGGGINLEYFISNPQTLESAPISTSIVGNQTSVVYKLIQIYLFVISFIALLIGLILILIAMKEINDKSKREVSLLKSFGYSNFKATSLVITPFIVILFLGFLLAVPFSILVLTSLSFYLTMITGSTFVFTLSPIQWILILLFLIVLTVFLIFYSFVAFSRTNPLDTIKETEE